MQKHRLRHSQFLRHNTVFFLGSVAVGALNYLYYPVLGRLLSPASFGEVQTLISLFLQLSIFLTVLSLVSVNIVTNIADEKQRNVLVLEFERLALIISVVLVISSILSQWWLQNFLQFASPWPFSMLALAIVVTVPFILRGALLRGKQRFGLVSAGNLIAAGAKIVFSVGLVALGLDTFGAITGLVLAQLLAAAYIAWWAYKLGLRDRGQKRFKLPDMRLLRPELKYGSFVLVGSLAITLQYSLDIIVIKHYFDAHTAGLYAGIASVGRIVFFLTASVAQVLISAVRMQHAGRQNTSILIKSLLLLTGLGLPVLICIIIAPSFVIQTLMGSSYATMASLLPRLSIAIFIVSILNLLIAYYLALRRYGIAVAAVLGLSVTYLLILWRHQTPAAVVDGLFLGSVVMLGLFGMWIAGNKIKGGAIWQTKS